MIAGGAAGPWRDATWNRDDAFPTERICRSFGWLLVSPGTRVVSNTFKMGDWSPDEFIEAEIGNTRAYLWYVPAQVEGTWEFLEEGGTDRFSVRFKQHHQELQATLASAAPGRTLRDAKLRGADIELTFGEGSPPRLEGEVTGTTIRLTGQRGTTPVAYVGTRMP